jgi:hypothetical protein
MEKAAMWIVRHPVLVAVFFAVGSGLVGYQTFQVGRAYGELCMAVAADARLVSEALGG